MDHAVKGRCLGIGGFGGSNPCYGAGAEEPLLDFGVQQDQAGWRRDN